MVEYGFQLRQQDPEAMTPIHNIRLLEVSGSEVSLPESAPQKLFYLIPEGGRGNIGINTGAEHKAPGVPLPGPEL